jgi:hypothetical protein
MIGWLGSAGMGAVWGWLAGMALTYTRLSWPLVSCLVGATLILLSVTTWMLSWRAMFPFLGAALLACMVYLCWMRELRRRVDANERVG